MVTAVGPPGGLLIARTPSKAASRRSMPRRPVPRAGCRAAVAVVGDADPQHPVGVPDVDPGLPGLGVLGHVGQQLADREVGGRLDRRQRGPVSSLARLIRAGVSRASARMASVRPRSASTGGWIPRTRARSSASALTEASLASNTRRAGGLRVGVDDLPGGVQGHAHGDQPGLGSVVQVPLDPADLGRPGVQGLGAGLRQLPHPLRQLDLPGRRQDGTGQQAVGPEQQRGRQHPDRGDGQAQHDQRPRGVAREGGRRDEPGELGPDEFDQAGRDDRDGRHGQRADEQVRRCPPQVPPGGRVRRQPSEPFGIGELSGGRGRVPFGDGQAAPVPGQLPGQPGQPPGAQQRGRQREPHQAQPGADGKETQQHALFVGAPVAHEQDSGPQGDQEYRGHDHDQQPDPGRHQRGERDPAGGRHEPGLRAEPRPGAVG